MARILLIDACPDFRAATHCMLKREGLDVIEAHDGIAGLQRAVEDAPDVILVSADLEGLDGLEICMRLSREPVTREIPVLMVGDSLDSESVHQAKRAGAGALVLRSDRAESLSSTVHEYLWFSACPERTDRVGTAVTTVTRERGRRIRAHA